MKFNHLGTTSLGLPITEFVFGQNGQSKSPLVLILGGVHGDEIEGVALARKIVADFSINFEFGLQVSVITEVNPEGVLLKTRTNSRGVDLNRNLPTKDWSPEIATPRYHPGPHPNSEIENQILSRWIELKKPNFILSIHSWKPLINTNGACELQAKILNEGTGYVIEESIGYPTPGCLGTYAGLERSIPTITLEIERGLPLDQVLKLHHPPFLKMLKSLENP